MRIFITGMVPTNTNNRGDDAVFMYLINQLRKKYKNCKIIAALRHPDDDYDKFFKIKSISNLEYKDKKNSIGKFFYGFNFKDKRDRLYRIVDKIKKANLVIIGGSPFEGISEENIFFGQGTYAKLIATICIILKKKYIIYAIKQYEFSNLKLKKIAKFVIENADKVLVRERYSLNIFKKNNIRTDHCKIIGDPVLNLNYSEKFLKNKSTKITKKFQINKFQKNDNLVIVCYRNIYWDKKNLEKKINKITKILDYLVKKHNLKILFVPLQNYKISKNDYSMDDSFIMNKIRKKMIFKKSTIVFDHAINLYETLYLCSISKVIISNRRHMPAFGSLFKKKLIGLIEKGNEENIIPFFKFLKQEKNLIYFEKINYDRLIHIFSKFFDNKQNYKSKKIITKNILNYI